MKYDVMKCRGFWLPEEPTATDVYFVSVLIAKGSWDEIEDADDERIFFYMDGVELKEGNIISDGFVVTEIEEV